MLIKNVWLAKLNLVDISCVFSLWGIKILLLIKIDLRLALGVLLLKMRVLDLSR